MPCFFGGRLPPQQPDARANWGRLQPARNCHVEGKIVSIHSPMKSERCVHTSLKDTASSATFLRGAVFRPSNVFSICCYPLSFFQQASKQASRQAGKQASKQTSHPASNSASI